MGASVAFAAALILSSELDKQEHLFYYKGMIDDANTKKYSVAAFSFYGLGRSPFDEAAAADLLAVERSLSVLRPEVVRAVEEVYFKPLEGKGDLSARVVKATFDLNYSERQIWYFLHEARLTFAHERGLRLG